MENEIAKREPTKIEQMFQRAEPELRKVLPEHIKPERMLRLMLSAIKQTPKLKDCTPASFIGAVLQSCQLGLEPNTVLGLAYLIPYGKECTFITGYKGLILLAYQSGVVIAIHVHLVYEKEVFRVIQGTKEEIYHEPILSKNERGKCIGGYCVVELKNGASISRCLSIDEINSSRPVHAKGSSPWASHWEEMALKTLVRRALKFVPLSPELSKAIALDEAGTRGAHIDLIPETAETILVEPVPEVKEPTKANPKDLFKENESEGVRDKVLKPGEIPPELEETMIEAEKKEWRER